MQPRTSLPSRVILAMIGAIRKVRTLGLATALVASLMVQGALSWRIYEVRRDNATIAALRQGDDVGVKAHKASGEVLIARSHFLLKRERWEEAQNLVDSSAVISDPKLRARLLYNHANARVRTAIAAVGRSDLDKAIPLTRLAKDEYRLALRLDPTVWDIKYNFDVAMRIVRDFPGYEQQGEDVPPDAPKRLWTDLPGVPKGLP
jgi:mxaK protein